MSIGGSLHGVTVVPARRGAPSDSSDGTRLLLAEAPLVRRGQALRALKPVLFHANADDRFIAGEFAVERDSRSSKPYERMEPQDAQRKFVE